MNTANINTNDVTNINNGIDSLLPFLPPNLVHILATISVVLVPLMAVGRILLGLKQSGTVGAVTALFCGTNVPKEVHDCPLIAKPAAVKISSMCAMLAAATIAAGCAHCCIKQTTTNQTWIPTNCVPVTHTMQQTRGSVWTFFDANDSVGQFQMSQSTNTQALSLGSLNQTSSSTNLNSIVSAAVTAAVNAAK
jgi:hypothetical protein